MNIIYKEFLLIMIIYTGLSSYIYSKDTCSNISKYHYINDKITTSTKPLFLGKKSRSYIFKKSMFLSNYDDIIIVKLVIDTTGKTCYKEILKGNVKHLKDSIFSIIDKIPFRTPKIRDKKVRAMYVFPIRIIDTTGRSVIKGVTKDCNSYYKTDKLVTSEYFINSSDLTKTSKKIFIDKSRIISDYNDTVILRYLVDNIKGKPFCKEILGGRIKNYKMISFIDDLRYNLRRVSNIRKIKKEKVFFPAMLYLNIIDTTKKE